jgi:hypothetical protein
VAIDQASLLTSKRLANFGTKNINQFGGGGAAFICVVSTAALMTSLGRTIFFFCDINCRFFSQHVRLLSGLKPDARMRALFHHYEFRSAGKRPHILCR